MRQLLRRVWRALRQRQFDADLREELAFHQTSIQQELERNGTDPTEARFAAKRALGSFALTQDQSHDVWTPRWLQGIWQDVRLASRTLRATPIVTTVAVLSLALGIGANSTIFSLIDTLILRTLPVDSPQRLATVSTGQTAGEHTFTYSTFAQIRQHAGFDGALAWTGSMLAIRSDEQPLFGQWVSGDFFATLGVPAILGRTITPADDVVGGGPDGPVAMISYGLWQRRFGGDPNAIGTSMTVERLPVTIVGITPPSFFGVEVGRAYDLFLPIRTEPLVRPSIPYDDDVPWLQIMLRLRTRQSLDVATAVLRGAQPQIRAASTPPLFRASGFLEAPFRLDAAGTGISDVRGRYARPLVTILVVVAFVLLIACANIANLQLARGAARRHELSVRVALGASRWRLVRQILVECVAIATIGGTLGLVLALWASRALAAELRVVLDLSLDWRVLAFTGVTMVVTSVLCGLASVMRATRVPPIDALKAQGRGTAGDAQIQMSSSLLVAQVAISLVLVVAAGLFARTFERLTRVSLGFDRDRVLAVTVTAPTVAVADRNPFYHRLVQAVRAVPGVAAAGGSMNPPLTRSLVGAPLITEPGTDPVPNVRAQLNDITPGWLAAYGTTMRAGRDIEDRDTETSLPVMLVNEAFVRRFFPGRSLLGATLSLAIHEPPLGDFTLGPKTVVGIVSDAVYGSLREPVPPTIYTPLTQGTSPLSLSVFFLAVRSSADSPALLSHSVASALAAVNPDLRLTFHPLADQVNDALTQDRLVVFLSGFFGALALLLAGLGLYGVTAYTVSRQRREIGIRMAMGARPSGIVRLVLCRVLSLVGLGLLLGAVVSLFASPFVATLLYGVKPSDPTTLMSAASVLGAVAAIAAWVPAWRASRIDPAVVLRNE